MALSKNEREALILARGKIARRQRLYICLALITVACDDPRLQIATRRLRTYIETRLGTSSTLCGWQVAQGITRTPHEARQDRLAWIDWMLGAKS